jgi:hypothetical protein
MKINNAQLKDLEGQPLRQGKGPMPPTPADPAIDVAGVFTTAALAAPRGRAYTVKQNRQRAKLAFELVDTAADVEITIPDELMADLVQDIAYSYMPIVAGQAYLLIEAAGYEIKE